jgi:hypothetical protein
MKDTFLANAKFIQIFSKILLLYNTKKKIWKNNFQ